MHDVRRRNDPAKLWANLVYSMSVRVVSRPNQDEMCAANSHSYIHINANENAHRDTNRDTYFNSNTNEYANLYSYQYGNPYQHRDSN